MPVDILDEAVMVEKYAAVQYLLENGLAVLSPAAAILTMHHTQLNVEADVLQTIKKIRTTHGVKYCFKEAPIVRRCHFKYSFR